MKKIICRTSLFIGAAFLASFAEGDMMDRPRGFKIGERMTLKPYVTLGFTYDSNHDQQHKDKATTSWVVNPALDLEYKADNWNLDLNVFYGYRAYSERARERNSHSYGESLRWVWSSAPRYEKGWTLMLAERFQRISEDDDLQTNNGRGLWRTRQTANINGAVQRRFNDKLHADLNASYYYLDYENEDGEYEPLYGWQRWTVGAEIGYAASQWTDIILAGGYQRYYQDNNRDYSGASDFYGTNGRYSHESQGWTVQGGLGSWATDRISYRVLAGWSAFEYGGGESTANGFTYTVSANWKITDTWNTMLLANSHYQPSERDYGSANRVDMVSWGLGKSLIRGKLRATLDLAYRKESRVYTDRSSYDYDEDIFSGRFGLHYTFNRYISIYGNIEYQGCWFNGDTGSSNRDYDRFRGNVGVRLTY